MRMETHTSQKPWPFPSITPRPVFDMIVASLSNINDEQKDGGDFIVHTAHSTRIDSTDKIIRHHVRVADYFCLPRFSFPVRVIITELQSA
jgi:hypothetical protein